MNSTELTERCFRKAASIIPQGHVAHEWLEDLRHDAIHGSLGQVTPSIVWLNCLKGYLRGLCAAKLITYEDLCDALIPIDGMLYPGSLQADCRAATEMSV